MSCDEIGDRLPAYVDGELELTEHLEVERHLQECAACTERLRRAQELRNLFAEPQLYHRAPAALRNRIHASLAPRSPRIRIVPARRWAPLSLTAAVLLAVIAGSWLLMRTPTSRQPEQQLVRALVSSHIRSLMPGHGPDVVSTDRHTVKPWFAGKLKFSPAVKDLADHGFPLVGGSVDYLDDHEVAELTYRRQKHVISLFAWPASRPTDFPMQTLEHNGYHVVHWSSGGFEYWAVSDLNVPELQEFARLLQS